MTYKQILTYLTENNEITNVQGFLPDDYELGLNDIEHLNEHTLDWDSKRNLLKVSNKVVISVRDAKRAIAMVGNHFFVKRLIGIHPAAIIESGAVIGERCYIGPYVHIHACVTIGNDVRINAGAVIGNEGFGFVRDANNNLLRFPQMGYVIISDDVEIGSNTTIDRGAFSNTIVGKHTKINNQVHIAHNVRIGENTFIAANVNISGSTIIGNNVWIAPGATLRDHITIGDKAVVGMGSNIVKNIPSNEIWCGNPACKFKTIAK